MLMIKKSYLSIILIAIVSFLIVVSVFKMREDHGLRVVTFIVKEEGLKKTVYTNGKITAKGKTTISSSVAGKITSLLVNVGDKVTVGQLLANLDNKDLEKEVYTAKSEMTSKPNQLEKLKVNLEQAESKIKIANIKSVRYRELCQKGAASRTQMEEADEELMESKRAYRLALKEIEIFDKQVHQSQLLLDNAERKLADTSIKTPVDGEIFNLNVKAGEYVNIGNIIAVIGKQDQVEITAEVNEVDSGKLAIGMESQVKVTAFPDNDFVGHISNIAPIANVKNQDNSVQNIVEVTVVLDNLDSKLKPGYSADITFVVANNPTALLIPHEALVTTQNNTKSVWFVKEGRAYQQIIQTGLSNELYIEVIKGLSAGLPIIINPSDSLVEGALVSSEVLDKKI